MTMPTIKVPKARMTSSRDKKAAAKKKVALVEELRDRKYEAFPRGESVKRARNTDEEMDQDDDEDNEDLTSNEPGAGDYDYLLAVRITPCSNGNQCTKIV